jgi:hypothetical protein
MILGFQLQQLAEHGRVWKSEERRDEKVPTFGDEEQLEEESIKTSDPDQRHSQRSGSFFTST